MGVFHDRNAQCLSGQRDVLRGEAQTAAAVPCLKNFQLFPECSAPPFFLLLATTTSVATNAAPNKKEEIMETQTAEKTVRRTRSDSVTLYRANAQGTGAVVRIEPRINLRPGDRYNCFFLEMARQNPAPAEGSETGKRATFDWENKITVKLTFPDLCEFLAVLEGSYPKVGGKRDGLYHQNGDIGTVIRFARHDSGGYAIGLSRKQGENGDVQSLRMILSEAEGIGLRHFLGVGLFFIALPAGVPITE